MPILKLAALAEYMHTRLEALLAHYSLAEDAEVKELIALDAFPSSPPEFWAAFGTNTPFDGDWAIPVGPSRRHALAWGDFRPESYLIRDCARVGLHAAEYTWVPMAVDRRFSRLLEYSRQHDRTTISVLDEAISYIECYISEGSRSWIGLELRDFDLEGSHTIGEERSWQINDEFDFVENPENYWTSVILRRHERADGEDGARATLLRMIELLRVQSRTAVETPQWWGYRESWETLVDACDFWAADVRRGTWLPGGTLDAADLMELATLWGTWSKRDNLLDAAIEHFEDALFSMSPADTAAHAIMCLESVVASRTPRGVNKRDVMARRAPRLLLRTRRNVDRTKELISALYTPVRGGKAHTDSLPERSSSLERVAANKGDSPEELALEVLGWAADAMLEMHKLLVGGKTLEEIWADLDRPSGRR